MGNTTRSGLATHDSTPVAWACLGRRGDAGAMARAKRMMHAGPEPQHKTWGSPNHYLIQALCNATVWRDYKLAEGWFKMMRTHGCGEGGSLYFPSGDCGYVLPLIASAEQDGRGDIVKQGREYLARVVEWMRPMAIVGKIEKLIAWLPSGEHQGDRKYQPTGPHGHVFFPGSRALFGHTPPGTGWYSEGPASVLYQWLTGAAGRSLPGRFAGYRPAGGEAICWDSWPWMIAMNRGWLPARDEPQPETMRQVFRDHNLAGIPAEDEPGPYKLRFGMEAIRFADGSMLCTCTHTTAAPKPPVNWVEYHAPSNTVRLAAPDGLITYGSTGKGSITVRGPSVYATAKSGNGVVMDSQAYRVDDVVSHLVLKPKSAGPWKLGALHPKAEPPAPGPEPPGPQPVPPRRKSDWVKYRYYILGAALIGVLVWWQGC